MDSSRIGLFGHGCVVMILAACAGCSSSSATEGPPATPDSGSTPPAGDGGGGVLGPSVPGAGADCPKMYPLKVGTLVTAKVSWPASTAVAKGSDQPYYLWLLTTYTADSNNKVTGTTATCGTTPAILTLTAIGASAEGAPMGATAQVRPTYPADSWTNVPPTKITGTIGGVKVGSSFEVDPSVSLQGLNASDPLNDPTKMWPPSQSAFTAANLTNADGTPYVMGMGHPGIRGVFDGTPPYYIATTSLTPGQPKADQFWTVNRVELGLYGTATSCTEATGQAFVKLINNHVVGCELANDGGPCTIDQYGFLDANTTAYTPTMGSFDTKDLPSTATCADVLSMFPQPAM
jgi:hypothetical protein